MQGSDFYNHDPHHENYQLIKERVRVMGRARAEDKYALVQALQANGSVVAYVVDSEAREPALKQSDVGFSMRHS